MTLMTALELSKKLNVHLFTIYRWIKQNKNFPVHKSGGRYAFNLDEVLEWRQKRLQQFKCQACGGKVTQKMQQQTLYCCKSCPQKGTHTTGCEAFDINPHVPNQFDNLLELHGYSLSQFRKIAGINYRHLMPFKNEKRFLPQNQLERIAEFLDISVEHIFANNINGYSLMFKTIFGDCLSEKHNGAFKKRLDTVLQTLSKREQVVLKKSFGLDTTKKTLAQIGIELGVSRERIRGIKIDALRKLTHPSRRRPLITGDMTKLPKT